MSDADSAAQFYRARVPEQFNRTLDRQRELARDSAEAARVLGEMEAVRASIIVRVEAPGGDQPFEYDVDRGAMSTASPCSHPPFLVLRHTLADFDDLRRECGDSLLGFLGGLAGLRDEMRLTSQRVRSLRELDGSLVFDRTGAGGFRLIASLGEEASRVARGESVAEPRATIRLSGEVYARLRAGELDPQDAFFAGQIEVLGDEAMAIELALTALASD